MLVNNDEPYFAPDPKDMAARQFSHATGPGEAENEDRTTPGRNVYKKYLVCQAPDQLRNVSEPFFMTTPSTHRFI